MKNLLASHNSDDPLALQRAARYYFFIKWLKQYYNLEYKLYATHFTVPGADLKISVSIGYIDPAHKAQVQRIVDAFNRQTLD